MLCNRNLVKYFPSWFEFAFFLFARAKTCVWLIYFDLDKLLSIFSRPILMSIRYEVWWLCGSQLYARSTIATRIDNSKKFTSLNEIFKFESFFGFWWKQWVRSRGNWMKFSNLRGDRNNHNVIITISVLWTRWTRHKNINAQGHKTNTRKSWRTLVVYH